MSVVEESSDLLNELMPRAREVAAIVRSDADEAEREARATPAVMEAFRSADLPWILVPRELGGPGLRWDEALELIEEISAADGSGGWTLMASAVATALYSTRFDAVPSMFAKHARLPVACGTLAPRATGVEVDGGLRISGGPIPFNSAFDLAECVLVMVLVRDEQGDIIQVQQGIPDLRLCLVDKADVENRGNWNVMGMAATGSYDIWVPEQFVPCDRIRRTAEIVPHEGHSHLGDTLDLVSAGVSGHAPVVLGIMRHALQEVASLAAGRRRAGYAQPIDQHPLFGYEFAKHEARYQAARQYFYAVLRESVDAARVRHELTALERDRIRQTVTYVHQVATEVVDFCVLWGGTNAVRKSSVLGRCARDLAVARTHALIDPVTLANAAPSLLAAWAEEGATRAGRA